MPMKKQLGAGLVEALIAVLILSIGLLGMLGMQTSALKYEQNSWIRSALASNISSFADRIRANGSVEADASGNGGAGLYSYRYDGAVVGENYKTERNSIESDSTYLTPAKNCDTTACTVAELAAYDIAMWKTELKDQFPGAVGYVAPTGTKGVDLRYLITVAWYDKDNLNAGVLLSPDTCAAGTTGISFRNCCPSAVVDSMTLAEKAGLRCNNVEMIP